MAVLTPSAVTGSGTCGAVSSVAHHTRRTVQLLLPLRAQFHPLHQDEERVGSYCRSAVWAKAAPGPSTPWPRPSFTLRAPPATYARACPRRGARSACTFTRWRPRCASRCTVSSLTLSPTSASLLPSSHRMGGASWRASSPSATPTACRRPWRCSHLGSACIASAKGLSCIYAGPTSSSSSELDCGSLWTTRHSMRTAFRESFLPQVI